MTNILIHSPCGGNGVTTITANLGVALARNGHPSLIAERSAGAVSRHFEHWNPAVSVYETPEFHGIRKIQVENLLFITNDRLQTQTSLHTGRDVSTTSRFTGKFTLVESGSKQLPSTEELKGFQFLIVVVSPDAGSFFGLSALLKSLCQVIKYIDNIKLLVVLNNYNPESMMSRDIHYMLEASLLQSFYQDSFLNDESVKEALACGIPLAEHAPYSPVSHALDTFALNLVKWSDNDHDEA